MVSPRDYQEECHNSVLAAWGLSPWHKEGDTYRSVIANLATSAGKTVIAGMIINTVKDQGPCLYLADTDELCSQPRKKFWTLFRMGTAVEKAGERASIMAEVVVGSAQTLIRPDRLHRYPSDHFKFIFVDEAHRGSDRNKVITDHFPNAKVMGMTATAFRAKLADLSDYYEHVAFEMGVFDLIDEGYIAPLKVLTLPVKVDIRAVHQKVSAAAGGMDYDTKELDTTIAPYYEEICRLILEHAPDRFMVVFLPLISSSQVFTEIARSMGLNYRHIDGKSDNRQQLIEGFERGQFQGLCNSSLLTTGWDCPRCDGMLNLAPTRSAGLFRQKVGRIGRVLPGVIDGIAEKDARKAAIAASAKPDALVLDLLWQTERFGLMGPTDLIAANAEERAAIQQKINGLTSAQDLQAVAAAVQTEREQALKRALIEAAKRRSTFNDTINLIAAMLHGRKVLNYEPVTKWERQPVTEKQIAWLEKNRIDPQSAQDRGHVSALMNLVFGRRKSGLCSHRAVEALEKAGIEGAISMTERQAYEILGGDYPCSFGKKTTGRPLRTIATSFWDWCDKRPWFRNQFPIEWSFAQTILRPDGDCRCIGAYVAPNCPIHPRPDAPAPPTGDAGKLFEVLPE